MNISRHELVIKVNTHTNEIEIIILDIYGIYVCVCPEAEYTVATNKQLEDIIRAGAFFYFI